MVVYLYVLLFSALEKKYDCAFKEARSIENGLEADVAENLCRVFEPMARTAFETVQGPAQQPVTLRWGGQAARRRSQYILFIGGKCGLTEGLFEVSRLQHPFVVDGEGCHKTELD